MIKKCIKVQPNHGKSTQNMHGASRNYRYVWDGSDAHQPCMHGSPGVRRKRGRAVNPKWRLSVLNVRQHISSLTKSYRRLTVPWKREPRLVLRGDKLQRQNSVALPHGKEGWEGGVRRKRK